MTLARSIIEAADALNAGRLTARALIETCLERIEDPAGEGARAMLSHDAARARAQADASDARRRSGAAMGPLAGIPISVKDLFDVAGERTTAGSPSLADAPVATATAPAIQRLVDAGAILLGRTNMTEFAFSGLGLNPHFGTPRAPWDRQTGRVPGGSSSGAAVSVADGMVLAAIGSDTGGSCRTPAAFCGVVGYKPSQIRVSREGAFPLSPTLDSVGPLATTVADAALVDAVLAGGVPAPLPAVRLTGLIVPVLAGQWLADLDPAVERAFIRAVQILSDAGAIVADRTVPAIDEVVQVNATGGFAAYEAYALHRERLTAVGSTIDPMVRARIERGANLQPEDMALLTHERARLIAEADAAVEDAEALLLPATAGLPPAIAAVGDAESWNRENGRALRNASWVNFLDRCAISLPCHRPGEPPVGLMLVGPRGGDRRLFAIAAAVEALLQS